MSLTINDLVIIMGSYVYLANDLCAVHHAYSEMKKPATISYLLIKLTVWVPISFFVWHVLDTL